MDAELKYLVYTIVLLVVCAAVFIISMVKKKTVGGWSGSGGSQVTGEAHMGQFADQHRKAGIEHVQYQREEWRDEAEDEDQFNPADLEFPGEE